MWSFCVPSIINYYGRWWWPLEEPAIGSPEFTDTLPFTGRFYDGFNNKVSMAAYANPTTENLNAAGHGIIRFKKSTREITMECWPRHAKIGTDEAKQFDGWPVTIKQEDNYNRAAQAHLPTLEISGAEDTVVQVIDEDIKEPVYTLRIQGSTFTPKVFREGLYTIKVGEGSKMKTFENVQAIPLEGGEAKTLKVEL